VRRQLIKRYFITGLLIWVPLAITAWVLVLIVGTMDQSLRLLPEAIHPRSLFGFDLPGVGAILTLLIIVVTGLLAANFIGQRLVVWWELLLARIPVVNSIYNSVKQVSDTLFSSSGNAFRQALLIEYPRRGAWTIAFLTGKPGGEMLHHLERGVRQRLCADDAESDLGLLPHAAPKRSHRTADERRYGVEIRHLDGRRGTPACDRLPAPGDTTSN
jgi:uncharacterized membrane protein